MWESAADGQRLRFRLVGINNQNFVMADDRTNSWWQQVSGRAILGPMKGRHLKLVPSDIVSFDTWRAEHPDGRVLAPDPAVEKRDGDYLPTTWEREMATFRTVTPLPKGSPFAPRQLVVGVTANGVSKAWSLDDLKAARVQLDEVGSAPLMIVVGDDGKSVRVFDRRIDGREMEFAALVHGSKWDRTSVLSGDTPSVLSDARRTEVLRHSSGRTEVPRHVPSPVGQDFSPAQESTENHGHDVGRDAMFVDVETGSEWDFAGRAISGPLKGRTLARVPHLLEYWFDWQTYQPKTLVHKPWNAVRPKPDPLTVPRPKD